MSYGQKKYKTPLELHKTLRNEYQLGLAQRHDFRRRMKLELKAEARHNQLLQRKLEEEGNGRDQRERQPPELQLDSTMLHRQLQLEIEIERLRSTIDMMSKSSPMTAPVRDADYSSASLPQRATTTDGNVGTNDATGTPTSQDLQETDGGDELPQCVTQQEHDADHPVQKSSRPSTKDSKQEGDRRIVRKPSQPIPCEPKVDIDQGMEGVSPENIKDGDSADVDRGSVKERDSIQPESTLSSDGVQPNKKHRHRKRKNKNHGHRRRGGETVDDRSDLSTDSSQYDRSPSPKQSDPAGPARADSDASSAHASSLPIASPSADSSDLPRYASDTVASVAQKWQGSVQEESSAIEEVKTSTAPDEVKDIYFSSLLSTPYIGRNPKLNITQSREHQAGTAPPLLSTPNVLPINTNRTKSGDLFVLPCAPNLGVSNMLQMNESMRDSEDSNWDPYTAMIGADTSSVGSGASLMMQPQQLSIEDQICRFAEIQSLFTQPSELNEEEIQLLKRLHIQSVHGEKMGSPVHRHGRDMSKIDIQHDENVEVKRQQAFLSHKMRHERARNPPRRFPMEVPPVNRPVKSSSRSPRARIHQVRYPQYTAESDYFRIAPNVKEEQVVDEAKSGDASRGISGDSSGIGQNSSRASPTTPSTLLDAFVGLADQSDDAKQIHSSKSNRVVSSAKSSQGNKPWLLNKSVSILNETSVIEDDNQTSTGSRGDHSQQDQDTINKQTSGPNQQIDEKGSNSESAIDDEVPEMTVHQFKVAHDRLTKKMNKIVQQAVVEELKEDCSSQHFTRTKQRQLLAKAKKPLTNRIEKKLNDKLQSLQKELIALRATKVNITKDRRRAPQQHDSEEEDSGVERDDDARNHGNGWYKKNELNKKNKKSTIDPSKIDISLDLKHNVEALLNDENEPQKVEKDETSTPQFPAIVEPAPLETPNELDASSQPPSAADPASLADVLADVLAEEEEEKPKKKKLTKAEKLMGFTEDGPPPVNEPPAPESTSRLFGLLGGKSAGGSPMLSMGSKKISSGSMNSPANGSKKYSPSKQNKSKTIGLKTINDDEASVRSVDSKASKGSRRGGKKKKNNVDAEARLQSLAHGGLDDFGVQNGGDISDTKRLEAELANETDNLAILIDMKSKIKKELKDWERNFERRVGRPPNDADKTTIEERFLAYRTASQQVKAAAQTVKSLEQKLKEAKD